MKKESWFLKIALIILSLIVLVIMGVFVRFIYVVFTDWREFTTAWAYLAMGLQIEALWAAFLYAVTQAWLILTRIERQEVFFRPSPFDHSFELSTLVCLSVPSF